MSTKSAAQRKAIAISIANKKKKATPRVVRGRGSYRTPSNAANASPAPYQYSRGYAPVRKYYYKESDRGYGSRLGSVIGEGAEKLFDAIGGTAGVKAIAGLGAYKVKANSLLLNEGNSPPIVKNAKDGRFIIRHREYLRDIVVPANNNGAFVVQGFKINPGLQSTFPWLSTVAQSFQQYRMRGMIFEFKTNYSEYNNAQPGMGTVIMGTEYDATLPLFGNKVVMENHQYSSSAKPSLSQLHCIECARGASPLTELYIRQTVPDDNNDLRFSDFGTFQIAHVGIPNSASPINLGELWVTYEFELLKPQLAGSGNLMLSAFYTNSTSINFNALFGTLTSMTVDPANEISLNFSYSANTARITVSDNVGAARLYFSVLWVYGSAVGRTGPTVTAINHCSVPTQVWGPYTNWQAPGPGESSTRQEISFYIDCTGAGPAVFDFAISYANNPILVNIAATTYDSDIGRNPLVPYVPFTPAMVLLPASHASVASDYQITVEETDDEEIDEKEEKDEKSVTLDSDKDMLNALIRDHSLPREKAILMLEEWRKNRKLNSGITEEYRR